MQEPSFYYSKTMVFEKAGVPKTMENPWKNHADSMLENVMQIWWTNHQKRTQNGSQNQWKIHKKRGPKKHEKWCQKAASPRPPGIPLSNLLSSRFPSKNKKTTINCRKVDCSASKGANKWGAIRLRTSTRSVANGPERISVAIGNIPAPGLGK